MAPKKSGPAHLLEVSRYDEFRSLVQAHAQGNYQLLAIVGPPGVAKTETVTRTMQAVHGAGKWASIRGKHTPLDLFRRLFEHRSNPVVLDDLDGLFAKAENTALLKAVCDTRPVKRVEWGSSHPAFAAGKHSLPMSFDSISRICLIANNLGEVSKDVGAILDRGLVVSFQPSALELHREISTGGWFDDAEVFDFIGEHLHLLAAPSCRFYLTARDHKRAGLDWRSLILRTIESSVEPATLLVARLLSDPAFDRLSAPETAREREFQLRGGGSRATFHRHKKALLQSRGSLDQQAARNVRLQPFQRDLRAVLVAEQREYLESLRNSDGSESRDALEE